MIVRQTNMLLDRDYFDETIQSCIDTLNRNKDKIYELLLDKTTEVAITFNFKPNEIINMDIKWNKLVYEDKGKESLNVEREKENEKICS